MVFNRNRSLPETVHRWRGRNWRQLQKVESVRGHTLKVVEKVTRKLKEFEALKSRGPIPTRKIRQITRGLIVLFTEMTDEWQQMHVDQGRPTQPWTTTYRNFLLHYWKRLPREIRREIIRQTKEN